MHTAKKELMAKMCKKQPFNISVLQSRPLLAAPATGSDSGRYKVMKKKNFSEHFFKLKPIFYLTM